MDFIVRYKRFDNLIIGFMLIMPALVMDYVAIDTKNYNFLIFTMLMTVFLGWFANRYLKNGIRGGTVVKFDGEGFTSFDPEFTFKWQDIYGYKLHEYSGKTFKTLEIELLFDMGRTSTLVNVSFCDRKNSEIDAYLSKFAKKYSLDEFEETFQKKFLKKENG